MTIRKKTLIPIEELTLSDRKNFLLDAQREGISRAITAGFATSEAGLNIRHAQLTQDFGSAAALNFWNTTALAAVGTAYSVFPAAATPAVPNNQIMVFYGAGCSTAPLPVSLLAFRQGVGGGTTYAVFDMEQLINQLRPQGLFSEPIVYVRNEVMNITVICRILTNLPANVQLGCYVVEALGATVSN